jgi:hypothetical protein
MAKPNYAFEKRQRDLAKKKKKEEKLEERKARKAAGGTADQGDHPEGSAFAPEGDVTDAGDGTAGVAEIQRDDPTGNAPAGDGAR